MAWARFGGKNRYPLWSADGARVAFQSDRDGDVAIFWQLADGTGPAERLTKPDQGTTHMPDAWSANGETLLFSVTSASSMSLWAYSVRDGKTAPFGSVKSTSGFPITAIAGGQTESGAPAVQQIQVVLNWFEELKTKVPNR